MNHTAEQFTTAINKALSNHDVKAAYGLLVLMALEHPREADELRGAILLGLAIAKADE